MVTSVLLVRVFVCDPSSCDGLVFGVYRTLRINNYIHRNRTGIWERPLYSCYLFHSFGYDQLDCVRKSFCRSSVVRHRCVCIESCFLFLFTMPMMNLVFHLRNSSANIYLVFPCENGGGFSVIYHRKIL